jgi:hypothetical protein
MAVDIASQRLQRFKGACFSAMTVEVPLKFESPDIMSLSLLSTFDEHPSYRKRRKAGQLAGFVSAHGETATPPYHPAGFTLQSRIVAVDMVAPAAPVLIIFQQPTPTGWTSSAAEWPDLGIDQSIFTA